jgi:lipopolysaccharide export system protein LptA
MITSFPTPRLGLAAAAVRTGRAGCWPKRPTAASRWRCWPTSPAPPTCKNQVSRFSGNVVITQGTMVIRPTGSRCARRPTATMSAPRGARPGQPVSYRQKRDGVDEFVEGVADRVEFDGKAEVLRFIGNGVVRRAARQETVDEITGALITWNHAAEQFSVQGGTPRRPTPAAACVPCSARPRAVPRRRRRPGCKTRGRHPGAALMDLPRPPSRHEPARGRAPGQELRRAPRGAGRAPGGGCR